MFSISSFSSNLYKHLFSFICLLFFHLFQFFSNFFRYSSSNFLSSYLYNSFAIYFPGNSLLLNLSALGFNFIFYFCSTLSCLLTSASSLPLNSSTKSFMYPKSFFFSHVSCSAVNPFHCTKYLFTPLIFLLFNILSISYSSFSSTFTGFSSSFLCLPTCSLYHTIQLIFTTGWILIKVGSCNLTVLVDTTFSIVYGLIYQSTSFLAGFSLNTKSLVLNNTLFSFFQTLLSFLPLSTCLFISSCTFFKAAPTSSYTFFILSTNSVAFSNFSFFLISPPILSFLL